MREDVTAIAGKLEIPRVCCAHAVIWKP